MNTEYFNGGRWLVLSYIADVTKMIKRWFANTCDMFIDKKMIQSKVTQIFPAFCEERMVSMTTEISWTIGIGRCLADITSCSVLSLFSLRRLTSIQWSISCTQRSMFDTAKSLSPGIGWNEEKYTENKVMLHIISIKMKTQVEFKEVSLALGCLHSVSLLNFSIEIIFLKLTAQKVGRKGLGRDEERRARRKTVSANLFLYNQCVVLRTCVQGRELDGFWEKRWTERGLHYRSLDIKWV